MNRIPLLALLTLVVGCGGAPEDNGPRDAGAPDLRRAFAGTWTVTSTVTLNFDNGGSETVDGGPSPFFFGMSASNRDEMTFATQACNLTATVSSETAFSLAPVVCSPLHENECTTAITVNGGTGTRSGDALAMTADGTLRQTCDAGVLTGTVGITWAGTRE